MVRIAEFNISEYGTIWGEPGDQIKVPGTYETADRFNGELRIRNWSGSWQYVFRCIDREKGRKLARIAEATVRNPHVGYSQTNDRTGFYRDLKAAGWDPSRITTDCNGDCSSGMAAWINAIGIPISPEMWTGTEKELIESTGEFLTFDDHIFTELDDYLIPGDILLRPGHTAMVIDYGDYVKSEIPGQTRMDMWSREDPSTSGAKIRVIKGGEPVDSMLPVMHGRWYLTTHQGKIGWSSAACYSWLYRLRITGYLVNMRAKPTINSQILDTYKCDQLLLATGISAEDGRGVTWYQASDGDCMGWVSEVYSRLEGLV